MLDSTAILHFCDILSAKISPDESIVLTSEQVVIKLINQIQLYRLAIKLYFNILSLRNEYPAV